MDQAAKIMLTHFDWTIQRLSEILNRENTPYYRSAALQRFGLTYEMALKCLQSLAIEPDNVAGNLRFIEDFKQDDEWLELVGNYNKIKLQLKENEGNGLAPDSELSLMLYNKLQAYHLIFQKLHRHLETLSQSAS